MDAFTFREIMGNIDTFIRNESIKEELYAAVSNAKDWIDDDTADEIKMAIMTGGSESARRATVIGLCS